MTASEVRAEAAKMIRQYGFEGALVAEARAAQCASSGRQEEAHDWRRIAAAARISGEGLTRSGW